MLISELACVTDLIILSQVKVPRVRPQHQDQVFAVPAMQHSPSTSGTERLLTPPNRSCALIPQDCSAFGALPLPGKAGGLGAPAAGQGPCAGGLPESVCGCGQQHLDPMGQWLAASV